MKYLIILFVTLFSFSAFSQNNGIHNENNVLKLNYVGKFNEKHTFHVVNKINCDMMITTDKNGDFSDHSLSSRDTLVLTINSQVHPAFIMRVKKRNGGQCHPQPDNGWIEVHSSSLTLPIVFWGQMSISQPVNSKSIIQWGGDETSFTNLSHYRIVYSHDGGKSFTEYKKVEPKNQKTTYRETININELKKN